jgi:Arc/MetJ-type ribon-helix-helix transcriptional regulator
MATYTIRSTEDVERALDVLTEEGQSRSAAIRQAVIDAARAHRRARVRAEAERLRNDPADIAAARQLEVELDDISAW